MKKTWFKHIVGVLFALTVFLLMAIPSMAAEFATTNIKATGTGNGEVTVSWDKVQSATGYIVYGKTSSTGVYHQLGITAYTNYVDKAASNDEWNFYWVYPYSKNSTTGQITTGKSAHYAFAKGTTTVKLPSAQNLKATGNESGVTLKWDAVAGAEGYLIYSKKASEAGSHYLSMRTHAGSGNSATTYTDTAASVSEYNFYWVFPYYTKNGSRVITTGTNYVYGKKVPQKLPPVKNLRMVECTDYTGNKLAWDAVPGAESYIVYRRKASESQARYLFDMAQIDSKPDADYVWDEGAPSGELCYYWVYPYYTVNGTKIITMVSDYVYGTRPDHNWQELYGSRHEPTCTENGSVMYFCDQCGIGWKTEMLPATGHSYVIKGNSYYCTVCGFSKPVTDKTYREGTAEEINEVLTFINESRALQGYAPMTIVKNTGAQAWANHMVEINKVENDNSINRINNYDEAVGFAPTTTDTAASNCYTGLCFSAIDYDRYANNTYIDIGLAYNIDTNQYFCCLRTYKAN